MNSLKRICVQYMDKRSLVTLVNAENVESIIQVCLLKHKIFNKRASDFSLRIEKFGCLIESPEEIQEDDILTLIPLEKSLDENLENNQLIKNLEENLVILEDKHQMEAEPNHESYYEFESRSRTTFSERSLSENFEDNVEMNQIEDEDEKIDEEILEEEEEEEEMSEENADECISIESIMTKEFTSRNELSNQLKIWASNSRFSLRFENGEKTTSEVIKFRSWHVIKKNVLFIFSLSPMGQINHTSYKTIGIHMIISFLKRILVEMSLKKYFTR